MKDHKSHRGTPKRGKSASGKTTRASRNNATRDHAKSGSHQDGTQRSARVPRRSDRSRGQTGELYLFGLHSVRAAFENPRRKITKLLTTKNAWDRLDIGAADQMSFPVEYVEPRDLDKLLGKDAIHQGVAIKALPLEPRALEELSDTSLIVVLDEVTDPHNVGAIMRSAVAMGAGAIITTTRNSPQETGVLAKSASGALEMIEHIQVKNLGIAIDELHFLGFQTIGLDSEGPKPLENTFASQKIALILGAEGKGLRHKTRMIATDLARLDMPGNIKSLNVSNAATLSLYAAHRFLLNQK